MTQTKHLDEQALIDIAAHSSPGDARESHVDQCLTCQREIETWQRISDVTKATVASVPPPKEDLAERILRQIKGRTEDAPTRPSRRTRPHPERNRGTRWLVATVGVAAAVVVSLLLALGSTAPSDAMVLATIKRSPSLVVAASKTVLYTATTVVRAPQGYTIIGYRTQGSLSPRTNVFRSTTSLVYPGGPPTNSTTYVSDGALVYLPCDLEWKQIGKEPCIAYPAQRGGTWDRLSLTFLRQARGPVTRLGQRKIGSVETTGYGVTVPVSAYIAGALPSERSLEQQSLATTKTLRIDVWSNNRGLPLELDLTYTEVQAAPPALLHITVHERLSYSQVPLRVTVPSRSTVVIAPSLNAAVQLADSYDAELGACFRSGCNG